MAKFRITLNMEYCRSADKDFRAGVEIASNLGYQYVEPMVHTGWGLLSEVGYFHSFSMEEDPLFMKEICDQNGIQVSSFSAHSPLMKPEAAVSRLTRAITWATVIGCDFCNSDWVRVAKILEPLDREIFLSVECGTIDEAERSLAFLRKELKPWLIEE